MSLISVTWPATQDSLRTELFHETKAVDNEVIDDDPKVGPRCISRNPKHYDTTAHHNPRTTVCADTAIALAIAIMWISQFTHLNGPRIRPG